MPFGPVVLVILGTFAAVAISGSIAIAASGGRAPWTWGLLGPVGWIIAALRGVQERLDSPVAPPRPRDVFNP